SDGALALARAAAPVVDETLRAQGPRPPEDAFRDCLAAPVAGPDGRRVRLARPPAEDQEHRRSFERDRLALHGRLREEHLARAELDGLAVAGEPRPSFCHDVELLVLLALAELVVGDDEELSLVRLERVRAERLDAEKAPHVVRLSVIAFEPLARIRPASEDVRRALLHRGQVLVRRRGAGTRPSGRNLAQTGGL